jgi:hypothetical protein
MSISEVTTTPITSASVDATLNTGDGTDLDQRTTAAVARSIASPAGGNLTIKLEQVDAPRLNAGNTSQRLTCYPFQYDGKNYDLTHYDSDGTKVHQVGFTEDEWIKRVAAQINILNAMKKANPNFSFENLNYHNESKTVKFYIPKGQPGAGTVQTLDFDHPDTIPDVYKHSPPDFQELQREINRIHLLLKTLDKGQFMKVINPPPIPALAAHQQPPAQPPAVGLPINQPPPQPAKPGLFAQIGKSIRNLANRLDPQP